MRTIDRVGLIKAVTCMREGAVLARMCAGFLSMFPGRCTERANELNQGADELEAQACAMEARALALDGCEA